MARSATSKLVRRLLTILGRRKLLPTHNRSHVDLKRDLDWLNVVGDEDNERWQASPLTARPACRYLKCLPRKHCTRGERNAAHYQRRLDGGGRRR